MANPLKKSRRGNRRSDPCNACKSLGSAHGYAELRLRRSARHEGGCGRKQEGCSDRDQRNDQGQRPEIRRQRKTNKADDERSGPGTDRPRLTDTIDDRADEGRAHQHGKDADVQERRIRSFSRSHRTRRSGKAQVPTSQAGKCEHCDGINDVRRWTSPGRIPDDGPHTMPDGLAPGWLRSARLWDSGRNFQAEIALMTHSNCGENSWRFLAPVGRKGPDDGAQHRADIRAGGEPSERAGAIFRRERYRRCRPGGRRLCLRQFPERCDRGTGATRCSQTRRPRTRLPTR